MSSPETPVNFTVMTYNIGNGLAKPDRLEALLRNSAVDIIGLQEIATRQREVLERIKTVYPYQVIDGEGIPGKAILSRYPIHESERLELCPDRPDIRAALQIGALLLTVIVVHPFPPRAHVTGIRFTARTRKHLEELVELARNSRATVMMGDFNMTDRNAYHRLLSDSGLVDAYRAAGEGAGYTLPVRVAGMRVMPFVRFDYIWHTTELRAIRAWVGGDAGSDHLPVLARLAWRESS